MPAPSIKVLLVEDNFIKRSPWLLNGRCSSLHDRRGAPKQSFGTPQDQKKKEVVSVAFRNQFTEENRCV